MKSKNKKWVIIVGIIIILIFSLNTILDSVVSNIANTQLEAINKKGELKVSFGDIKLNVFAGNLNLKDVKFIPDSLFYENFKQGKTEKASLSQFEMSELKIKGFGIYDLLVKNEISVNNIVAKGLKLDLYKLNEPKAKNDNESTEKKKKKTDSIFIEGIDKIDFNSIIFDDFELNLLDVKTADTLFAYSEEECEILGVKLDAHAEIDDYFVVNKDDLKVNFKEQEIISGDGNTKITLSEIKYDYKTSSLLVSNFSMQPRMDKAKLASTYRYNSEVYQAETKSIHLKGFHLDSILRTGIIKIDTILVDAPIVGIYKDQTKPFNLNKRPKFLNQKLKASKLPLNIEKVIIQNGTFSYWEKHPNFKELMTVDISNLNVLVSNVTSLKDSLENGNDLVLNVKGNLCNTAPINLDIFMDYNTWNNSYSFTGTIGKAKFTDFNPAIYPAAGIKFSKGTLNSIQFTVHGTPTGSSGKMSMLYENLEADLSNAKKEKKGLSWIANTVLVESNPSKKGKLKVAEVNFERVPYKGFTNLLWKSVQSGLMNTILPIGKHKKYDTAQRAEAQVKHSKKKKKKRKD